MLSVPSPAATFATLLKRMPLLTSWFAPTKANSSFAAEPLSVPDDRPASSRLLNITSETSSWSWVSVRFTSAFVLAETVSRPSPASTVDTDVNVISLVDSWPDVASRAKVSSAAVAVSAPPSRSIASTFVKAMPCVTIALSTAAPDSATRSAAFVFT